MINKNIFRAYDIRGVYGKDFDLEGVRSVARAYGTYLLRYSSKGENLRVCVAMDARTHSPEIHKTFMEGLCEIGINVVDLGLAFSPLLYFSTYAGDFDGGVMVTASHNDAEYNGFKFQAENAHAIFGDAILEIYDILNKQEYIVSKQSGKISNSTFWPDYKRKLHQLCSQKSGKKIVIDAGNGVAGKFAPELFREMGYIVEELYCDLDGSFPNHLANPEEEGTLEDLKKKVISTNSDFGIAFDGDGDRLGIIDSNAKVYNSDLIYLLLIRDLFTRHKKAKVIHTVTSSGLIAEEIKSQGGIPVESRVGHSYIENIMRDEGAMLGGEPSGHFFFAEEYYGFDDAFLAGLRVLNYLHSSKKSLDEHFSDLPEVFTSHELKIFVEEEKKQELIKLVKEELSRDYEYNTIDGIKVFFSKTDWAVCRLSNTNPEIKIRVESRTKLKMKEHLKYLEDLVRRLILKIESTS